MGAERAGGGGGRHVPWPCSERTAAASSRPAFPAPARVRLQDIFNDDNIEDEDEDAEAVLAQRQPAAKRQRGAAAAAAAAPAPRGGAGDAQLPAAAAAQAASEGEEEEDEEMGGSGSGSEGEPSSGSDAEGEPGTAAARKRQKAAGGGGGSGGATGAGGYRLSADALAGPEDGFEVVPAAGSGSEASESEDEFELMDDHAKVGGGGSPGAAAGCLGAWILWCTGWCASSWLARRPCRQRLQPHPSSRTNPQPPLPRACSRHPAG